MSLPNIGDVPGAISETLSKEIRRMIRLRKPYNPIILQSLPSFEKDREAIYAYIDLIKIFIDRVRINLKQDYVTKSEAKKIIDSLRPNETLGSRDRWLSTKFLNDLRRLGIIELYVETNNLRFKAPIIFPWIEYLKVDNRRVKFKGFLSDLILSSGTEGVDKIIPISFLKGNIIMIEIIREIFYKYGEFKVNLRSLTNMVNERLREIFNSYCMGDETLSRTISSLNMIKEKDLRKSLSFLFILKEDLGYIKDDTLYISDDAIKQIASMLGIVDISYEQYYQALKLAWREYWGEWPPWYASLEDLKPNIEEHLSAIVRRPVTLSLEDHLKYIREFAKWGKVEYWVGGLDPSRRHWIRIRG